MSQRPPSPILRLQSVQALRAVAALLVVFFHAAAIWREWVGGDLSSQRFPGLWDQGWAGVDLFFVISGFIMVWVAGDRPQGVRVAGRFLFDRATRIYPLWWLYCAAMAAYFFITYGQPASPVMTDTPWLHFVLSMLLWPQTVMPVLPVGWTLIYEMVFYALFAALLLLPSRWRGCALAIWAVILLIIAATPPPETLLGARWLDILTNPLCLEFLFGAGIAYFCRSITLSSSIGRALTLIGSAVFLLSMAVSDESWTSMRVWAFGVPASLILLGLVNWDRHNPARVPNWLQELGDASYTLYLSHFLILLALKRIVMMAEFDPTPSAPSFFAFVILGTTLCAGLSIWLYRNVEQPLLHLARRPLVKPPSKGQS